MKILIFALMMACTSMTYAKQHVVLLPLKIAIADKDLPEITDCKSLSIHMQNNILKNENMIATIDVTPATIFVKKQVLDFIFTTIRQHATFIEISEGSQRLLDCLASIQPVNGDRHYIMQFYQDEDQEGQITEHYALIL